MSARSPVIGVDRRPGRNPRLSGVDRFSFQRLAPGANRSPRGGAQPTENRPLSRGFPLRINALTPVHNRCWWAAGLGDRRSGRRALDRRKPRPLLRRQAVLRRAVRVCGSVLGTGVHFRVLAAGAGPGRAGCEFGHGLRLRVGGLAAGAAKLGALALVQLIDRALRDAVLAVIQHVGQLRQFSLGRRNNKQAKAHVSFDFSHICAVEFASEMCKCFLQKIITPCASFCNTGDRYDHPRT
jgi:hypothetical protein